MSRSQHPSNQTFVEPAGVSKTFSLHLSGPIYDYVMRYARTNNITRNRAVNAIIEEHSEAATRRGKRSQ